MAIATDVAELVGAALGLNLLFGVPLKLAVVSASLAALAMLSLRDHGYRRFELAIAVVLGLSCVGFGYEILCTGVSSANAVAGLVPSLAGSQSALLAVGIVGATVMPHAVYLHSALTSDRQPLRSEAERGRALRGVRLDILLALGTAGLVNVAMMVMAAQLFRTGARTGDVITAAHHVLGGRFGEVTALIFRGAAGLGAGLVGGGHVRRAGRAPGVPGPHDFSHAAVPGHHATRRRDSACRRRPDAGADLQPGGVVLRNPVRAHPVRAENRIHGSDQQSCSPTLDP